MAKTTVTVKVGGWERVGTLGVDSGQMMMADPCYVLPRDGKPAGSDLRIGDETIPVTFEEHCIRRDNAKWPEVQFPFGEFRAVTVSTGFGDGVYGVDVKRATVTYVSDDGTTRTESRIAEMRVKFMHTSKHTF